MKRFLIAVFLFGVATLFFLSCQKELSQESNMNNATFSLLDDSSNCLSTPVVNGDYYNGVPARDVNFVTVVVNVKTTGNYAITTISENGFYFADSGFFSSVGLDTLVLKMKGRPIFIQNTDFSFSDSNTCSFEVDVQDSTGTGLGGVDTSGSGVTNGGSASYVDPNPAADGTWHFTDSTNNKTYSGTMPGASLNTTVLNIVTGTGVSSANANEAFNFSINLPSATITTGSYAADGTGTQLILANSADLTNPIEYVTDGTASQEATDPSYVNITGYDASKRIKISFRCWATDASGNAALIKGSLNTVVQ